ncbi:MAG: glycosyltransferase family 2 protein [Bacteroidales bacterium]|nr:glycosyltransferase family 2 protein [Bacteroidales bacterium]
MKKIGAITMVRDDEFFLRKWVDYYSARLGRENLFVIFDGKDQTVPSFCEGVNVEIHDRVEGDVARADKGRINLISDRAGELLTRKGYEMVIGTDVDEFLVVDPAVGKDLAQFLSDLPERDTWSGLGIDIGQNLEFEGVIDPSRLFLEQRRFGWLSSRYTKASVITTPVRWGSGFHRVKNRDFKIASDLYLLHFGCVDLERIRERCDDTDRLANGWSRHLKKRARTISIVTAGTPKPLDSVKNLSRTVQTFCRQLFSPNKPATYGWRQVVELPARFRNLL